MSDRYYVDEPISPGQTTLEGPEAHHLIHVMRAAPGLHVTLFDGSGAEFPAVVERIDRNKVVLNVRSREPVSRELPLDVTLAVALPKGDRQKYLVEKAVELGVKRIVPLRTQRGVAQPDAQTLARLRRTVVEASKQCGRNRLLRIDEPRSWPEFIEDTADAPCRLLAHPRGLHGDSHPPVLERPPDRVCLAIGPEGGLTDEEVASAVDAGWHMVDLGPRILRVETAALLMVAIVTVARRD